MMKISGPVACETSVLTIIEKFGKQYVPVPVPAGLPGYRTIFRCHYNCWRAIIDDARLRYVEGVARCPASGLLIGHVWVTLDGEHAIDLTWRGQKFRPKGSPHVYLMARASEYFGVETPRDELLEIVRKNGATGLILEEWAAKQKAVRS